MILKSKIRTTAQGGSIVREMTKKTGQSVMLRYNGLSTDCIERIINVL